MHVTLYAFRFLMSSTSDVDMPATHPGATLRLSTLEVWEAIGQVRETQVQQATMLTALTDALTVTLVTPNSAPIFASHFSLLLLFEALPLQPLLFCWAGHSWASTPLSEGDFIEKKLQYSTPRQTPHTADRREDKTVRRSLHQRKRSRSPCRVRSIAKMR